MTVVPRTKTLHRRCTTRHIRQKWFSTIDQRKAYQQRFMYPDGRHLTAFVNSSGLYEWIHIQTGLKNTPGEFQRFMEDCLRDFRDDFCEPYLDDVIVYSKLRENGIKLRANMCNLFQKRCVILECIREGLTNILRKR